METTNEPDLKSLIDDIIKKYISFIGAEKLQTEIYNLVASHYDIGLQEAEVQFDMNFVPDYNAVNFVQKFAFDNVRGLTEELKEMLRKEMTIGLLNNENPSVLRQRVVKVMDIGIERAKLIQITESNRAHNAGHLQAAKESRLDLVKQWNAQPERISRAGNQVPCPICESLDGQVREMNDKFVDVNGKEYDSPVTSHPRCACRVIFIQRADLPKPDTKGWVTRQGKHIFIQTDVIGEQGDIDNKEANALHPDNLTKEQAERYGDCHKEALSFAEKNDATLYTSRNHTIAVTNRGKVFDYVLGYKEDISLKEYLDKVPYQFEKISQEDLRKQLKK